MSRSSNTGIIVLAAVMFTVMWISGAIMIILYYAAPDKYAPFDCSEWRDYNPAAKCCYDPGYNSTHPCKCVLPDFSVLYLQSDGTRDDRLLVMGKSFAIFGGGMALMTYFGVIAICTSGPVTV